MIALSSLAALAISAKVSRALAGHVWRADAEVAGRALIEGQLQAIHDQLRELAQAARDVAELEKALAHTSARIEEWTA